ncbi:MAG TPA: zinc metallopeptidase [Nitrospirales bacterium]|nr:zinc metallopeptidase [Nitrospira sp. MA-1]HNP60970.1 zinc metallopeptidase [Nitrospirales bacterium]
MRMILLFLLLMIVVLGPQLWVWWVFRQYRQHREDLGGTGGELARHLLNRFGLQKVRVEPTPMGDHYNPETKVVGLNPKHYNGRSLTAAVIAAHEVGHALQDHEGYSLLKDRTHLIKFAQKAEKAGSYLMLGIPVLAGVTRIPAVGLAVLVVAIGTMSVSAMVHLITLPVEWNASFRRALPILREGGYLAPPDLHGAKRILTAAALTYVASSLFSLVNMWRWIRLVRR